MSVARKGVAKANMTLRLCKDRKRLAKAWGSCQGEGEGISNGRDNTRTRGLI